jgi:hypothetical protein
VVSVFIGFFMVTLLVRLGGFLGGTSDAVDTFFSAAPNFEINSKVGRYRCFKKSRKPLHIKGLKLFLLPDQIESLTKAPKFRYTRKSAYVMQTYLHPVQY